MLARMLTLVCFGLAVVTPRLAAQEPAKPGPEHEMLKKFVGDWDATVSIQGSESKATCHNEIGLGGLWVLTDFKGEFAGAPFSGKGATGYDPAKKKYVGTWIDSMSPSVMLNEGSFDADGKTFTETGSGTGPGGKPIKWRNVYEFPSNDKMLFTMYMTTDGKEAESFKITYQRK